MPAELSDKGDLRPVPDPTILTTQAVLQAVGTLDEKLTTRIKGEVEAIKTRLDGIQRAIDLAHADQTRVPTIIDKEIAHLKSVNDERFYRVDRELEVITKLGTTQFEGIQGQLKERDIRSQQNMTHNKLETDAALQGTKEAAAEQNRVNTIAVNKSEIAIQRQIDQLVALINSGTEGLRNSIEDLKERMTRAEGLNVGHSEAKIDQHSTSSFIVSIVLAIVAFISVAVAIIALVKHR